MHSLSYRLLINALAMCLIAVIELLVSPCYRRRLIRMSVHETLRDRYLHLMINHAPEWWMGSQIGVQCNRIKCCSFYFLLFTYCFTDFCVPHVTNHNYAEDTFAIAVSLFKRIFLSIFWMGFALTRTHTHTRRTVAFTHTRGRGSRVHLAWSSSDWNATKCNKKCDDKNCRL